MMISNRNILAVTAVYEFQVFQQLLTPTNQHQTPDCPVDGNVLVRIQSRAKYFS